MHRVTSKYIIMPTRGLSSSHNRSASSNSRHRLLSMHSSQSIKLESKGGTIKIIDSIHEDGAKLVEMQKDEVLALKAASPGLKIIPLSWFQPQVVKLRLQKHAKVQSGASKLILKIVDKKTGDPIAGAEVIAFTDYLEGAGADGKTSKTGEVKLDFSSKQKKIEVLMIYPKHSYWSLCQKDVVIINGDTIELSRIEDNYQDCVNHFYGKLPKGSGEGVKVAVIDTGCGPHPDLVVKGGENTTGEASNDFLDNGDMHGTHVAGIIAGQKRGIAKDVDLYSYRVFRKSEHEASNYAIAKAIDKAVQKGCHLINMSLGGGPADDATKAAIEDARAAGSLVVVAAGNDGGEVSYPAAFQMAVAVSAMGRKGTFPAFSADKLDIGRPLGSDKDNFFAKFSNFGPQIDVTGPGVAVISTVPSDYYAEMSGTSMACPAVVGVAARLISNHKSILNMASDQDRSDAIAQLLFESADMLGLGDDYEGQGMPR